MTPPHEDTPGHDPATLSASVSHHVRSLFVAAERSAAAIRAEAEEQAALITAKAEAEARRIREEAQGDAAELLAGRRRELAVLSDEILRAGQSALADLESVATARAALDGLARSLRETAERTGPAADSQPESPVVPLQERPLRAAPEPAAPEPAAPEPAAPAPVDGDSSSGATSDLHASNGEPASAVPAPQAGAPPGLTGARLVAFQMAQAGSTRGEVAAHLRRTFAVEDVNDVLNEAFPAQGE